MNIAPNKKNTYSSLRVFYLHINLTTMGLNYYAVLEGGGAVCVAPCYTSFTRSFPRITSTVWEKKTKTIAVHHFLC